MGRPTYLIAKFVPDLFRNEPVNIGVIVWIDGRVESKFIAQRADGEVDGRFLPKEIKNHTHVYKQWIDTWRKWTAKDKISPVGHSEVFVRGDAKFMEALQSTGKGNYILESGGEILEDVTPSNIGEVVEHLFLRLVDSEGKARKLLETMLWPNGPVCPHCKNATDKPIYKIKPSKASQSPTRSIGMI